MALLTATQGTPHRIWSLLQILDARGEALSREEIEGWMNPEIHIEGESARSEKSAVGQTIDATAGLGFIDRNAGLLGLSIKEVPKNAEVLADEIYNRLASTAEDDADSVMLEALALVLAKSNAEKACHWASSIARDPLADFLRDYLGPGHDGKTFDRFNPTKLTSWKRWLEFLGLWRELSHGMSQPVLTKRLGREVSRIGLATDAEIDAVDFLAKLRVHMPFVDGGRLYEQACERLKLPSKREELSVCFSAALRELDTSGTIKLIRRGDAPGGVSLSRNKFSKIGTFHAVKLLSGCSSNV